MEDLKILVEAAFFASLSFLVCRKRKKRQFRTLYRWARQWEEKTWACSWLSEADERLSRNASRLTRELEGMREKNILFADFDELYERCIAESGEWDSEGGEVTGVGVRAGKGRLLERDRTFNKVFLRKKA